MKVYFPKYYFPSQSSCLKTVRSVDQLHPLPELLEYTLVPSPAQAAYFKKWRTRRDGGPFARRDLLEEDVKISTLLTQVSFLFSPRM